jgi:hypothetical protein
MQKQNLKRQRKTTGEDAGQFDKVGRQKLNNRTDNKHQRIHSELWRNIPASVDKALLDLAKAQF